MNNNNSMRRTPMQVLTPTLGLRMQWMTSWMAGASKYNFNHSGFSSATGITNYYSLLPPACIHGKKERMPTFDDNILHPLPFFPIVLCNVFFFSSSISGHFTQVVWKNTTQVAYTLAQCGEGAIIPHPSKYIVCRYTPPGSYAGQFSQNVGRHV
jgi:hypothetical protein